MNDESVAQVAVLLSKVLTPEQLVPLVDALLSADDNAGLNDAESALGEALFDALCAVSPEAVELCCPGYHPPEDEPVCEKPAGLSMQQVGEQAIALYDAAGVAVRPEMRQRFQPDVAADEERRSI